MYQLTTFNLMFGKHPAAQTDALQDLFDQYRAYFVPTDKIVGQKPPIYKWLKQHAAKIGQKYDVLILQNPEIQLTNKQIMKLNDVVNQIHDDYPDLKFVIATQSYYWVNYLLNHQNVQLYQYHKGQDVFELSYTKGVVTSLKPLVPIIQAALGDYYDVKYDDDADKLFVLSNLEDYLDDELSISLRLTSQGGIIISDDGVSLTEFDNNHLDKATAYQFLTEYPRLKKTADDQVVIELDADEIKPWQLIRGINRLFQFENALDGFLRYQLATKPVEDPFQAALPAIKDHFKNASKIESIGISEEINGLMYPALKITTPIGPDIYTAFVAYVKDHQLILTDEGKIYEQWADSKLNFRPAKNYLQNFSQIELDQPAINTKPDSNLSTGHIIDQMVQFNRILSTLTSHYFDELEKNHH